MSAFEVLSGAVTNPGAVLTALTMAPGDSLTIRSYDPPASAHILELWTSNATGGALRIRSPRLHDNVQGVRLQVPAGNQLQYLPRELKIPLRPVDLLIAEMSGGGAEVDLLSMLVYYSQLDGSNGKFASWDEVRDRIVAITGTELDLVSGATAGQYGGSRSLNQDFPNLKADTSYALLGYTSKVAFGTLRIKGTDTGNLGVGAPGTTNTDVTSDWFIRLGQNNGIPAIPIIKANNQGATLIDLASTDTATAHTVSLILAELG